MTLSEYARRYGNLQTRLHSGATSPKAYREALARLNAKFEAERTQSCAQASSCHAYQLLRSLPPAAVAVAKAPSESSTSANTKPPISTAPHILET